MTSDTGSVTSADEGMAAIAASWVLSLLSPDGVSAGFLVGNKHGVQLTKKYCGGSRQIYQPSEILYLLRAANKNSMKNKTKKTTFLNHC